MLSAVSELNGARRKNPQIEVELERLGLFELNELTDGDRCARVLTDVATRAAELTGAFRQLLVTRAIESLEIQKVPGGPRALRSAVSAAAKQSKRRAKASDNEPWREGLIYSDNGTPTKGVANVLHVLVKHPDWHGVLAEDAFRGGIVKLRPPPVRPQDGHGSAGEWTEADTTRTATWFATHVGVEPSSVHVEQAVGAAAARNVIHPVRDYLRSLKWDERARLDRLLTCFGAPETPYTRAVGARYLISAVARVMQPGCQADCMLVLEGAQGTGKSTGFEALFGAEWFADTGIAIGDKDSYQALRGKWGFEFGELDAIKGREVTKVKNFVSARVDTYRPSYARRTQDFQRQLVFCGTTNETEYLVDRTGNRRFWPVRCTGVVDVQGIRRDRDQLWAEAFVRYSAGESWHVDTPELRALCEAEQAARETEDPWTSIVARWLSEQTMRREISPVDGVAAATVMSGALNLSAAEMHHAQVTRLGHVLRQLGWEPRQLRREGERTRLYFPASRPTQPDHETGCDANQRNKQGDIYTSQVSHPHNISPVCAPAPAPAGLEQTFLGRDGCDAVTLGPIDMLEREAIEAEGRGDL